MHAERVKAYKARVAKVAIPDSTAEEGDNKQRAACSATRTPAPAASFTADIRFVISFSDSDDDELASRSASYCSHVQGLPVPVYPKPPVRCQTKQQRGGRQSQLFTLMCIMGWS